MWAPSGKELELVSVINRDTRLECLHKTHRRGATVQFFVYVQSRARLARLESKIPENALFLLSSDPKFDSVDDMCSNQMSRLTTAQKLVDEGDLSKLVQQMYSKPIR